MSPHTSRRALLRAVGAATLAGLAGCGGDDGSPTPGPGGSDTYGFQVVNQLTGEDFEDAHVLPEPVPATVHLRVGTLDPGSDETFFEETTTVDPGGSRTFEDAFTVTEDGPTYAVSAELEPLADEPLARASERKAGLTFAPEERPSVNPIPVVVVNLAGPNEAGIEPAIDVRERPLDD